LVIDADDPKLVLGPLVVETVRRDGPAPYSFTGAKPRFRTYEVTVSQASDKCTNVAEKLDGG
jgi:hypothetical protein